MSAIARHTLRCLDCSANSNPSLSLSCPSCGGLWEIEYHRLPPGEIRLSATPLPLGEGDTPTIAFDWEPARTIRLDLKLEFLAPTGSFKDRGAAMLIGAAWGFGTSEFVEDSSGNAGAALAAYGAAARMRAHIFLPADAAPAKFAQIEAVGATAHPVEGPRSAATEAAEAFAQKQGLPFLSHNRSPYFSEGMKPAAAEIANHGLPDSIVLPVGNGSLLIGLHRGFEELRQIGTIERIPKLHAVQATAVSPLAAAFRNHEPPPIGKTIAEGIAVAEPPRMAQMLAAIRETRGTATAVSELEIASAHREIGRRGLYVEPTSAVPFAALSRLIERGMIGEGERVLIPVTGSGLKSL